MDIVLVDELDHPADGVVRWVASQSTNPALQALMREAEREKQTRPASPVASWSYSLASTASWQSSAHSADDPPPLSGDTSSSSLVLPASEPSLSRRAKPLSAAQRKPLASSTSSVCQPLHDPVRPRSSSHSTIPPKPRTRYIPQEEEPEAMAFIELLRDVSRQLDHNSEKKQRLAAHTKERERERSLGRSGIHNRTGLETTNLSARPLTKTSSASAICLVRSSTRPMERTSSSSASASQSESRGRVLAKTASLGAPGVDLLSGKSTPTSLPSFNLNCGLKLAPTRTSATPHTRPTATSKSNTLEHLPVDGDCAMEDVIDLTESDTEWERPISGQTMDTATYMQVDDDDMYSDTAMDTSFIQAESPPQARVPVPKPKQHPPQPNATSRPPASTQRTRTGPPPLGMRRAPQPQPSQYSSQGSKGTTVPRFKPPLLTNTGGTANKSRNIAKPAPTIGSKLPKRVGATKVAMVETTTRPCQDADSSFDISFDVDADALEEAMKAYD